MNNLRNKRLLQQILREAIEEGHGNSKVYDKCQKGWRRNPKVAQGKMKKSDKGSCIKIEGDTQLEESDESAFMGAIAAAKKDGKDEVEIDGKKFPVTMSDETADEIVGETALRSIIRDLILEACYDGRKVTLNKPSSNRENPKKKSKVYVKGKGKYKSGPCKGQNKAKKVQFGDPNMRIRKSNPKARSNFRKRHKCHEKKPIDSAGYWSCKAW